MGVDEVHLVPCGTAILAESTDNRAARCRLSVGPLRVHSDPVMGWQFVASVASVPEG